MQRVVLTMPKCPQCGELIEVSTEIFRRDFQCRRCAAKLRTAPTYSRVLSVLSLLVAAVVLWVLRNWVDFILFLIPAWLLILFAMLRTISSLLPPRLEDRNSTEVTTLALDHGECNRVTECDSLVANSSRDPTQPAEKHHSGL